MKKTLLLVLMLLLCVTTYGKKKLPMMTSDESLRALTQITDMKKPCVTPYGGANGKNLYFASCDDKGFYNIYRKENAVSASMTQITSGKNLNWSPCYCAAIDKIAFRCKNEGSATSEVFTMQAQGKTMSPMTESSDYWEGNPDFSPNGEWVAYNKNKFGMNIYPNVQYLPKSEIWLKNIKTGESILLGNGYGPRFSPDGKKIAFVKGDANSTSIWIVDVDGSNPVMLTDAKKGYVYGPSWSPDGKRLVFECYKKDKKDFDLYVISIDGSNLLQLTKNKSKDMDPYWAADNTIYFVSDRGNEPDNDQIWRFNFDE